MLTSVFSSRFGLFRWVLIFGAVFGLLSVILGALGAHSLKGVLTPALMDTFKTAVNYQMQHAVVLLVVGLLSEFQSTSIKWLKLSAMSLIFGILLFSGSLYLIVFSELKFFGVIAPVGGLCLIMGWVSIIVAVFSSGSSRVESTDKAD